MKYCSVCEKNIYKNDSYCINCMVNKLQLYSISSFLLVPIILLTKPDLLFNLYIDDFWLCHQLNFISTILLFLFTLICTYSN